MSLTPDATIAAPSEARACLGCGYDLRGLGEEPRCPECGLLNVPQGYREEVWKLVDSGKWFFSGFFHPFKKRPPGWWWSLDRPGDVARSWRFVASNLVVVALVLFFACYLCDLYKLEIQSIALCYDSTTGLSATSKPCCFEWLGTITTWESPPCDVEAQRCAPGQTLRLRDVRTVVYRPSGGVTSSSFVLFLAVVTTWLFPATAGLFSQVRRRLPAFAKPKSTLVAAANYESQRLIYTTVLVVVALGVYLALQLTQFFLANYWWSAYYPVAIAPLIVLFATAGWIGPLRSDYTCQLIQSNWQTGRVLIFYAFVLPLIAAFVFWAALADLPKYWISSLFR